MHNAAQLSFTSPHKFPAVLRYLRLSSQPLPRPIDLCPTFMIPLRDFNDLQDSEHAPWPALLPPPATVE